MTEALRKQKVEGVPEDLVRLRGAVLDAPGYDSLAEVLQRAFEQAAAGKGKERHSKGQPFHLQPIVSLQGLYGAGYAFGQVGKKMEEAQRLPQDRAVAELLGAINYLAAAVIHLEDRMEGPEGEGADHG